MKNLFWIFNILFLIGYTQGIPCNPYSVSAADQRPGGVMRRLNMPEACESYVFGDLTLHNRVHLMRVCRSLTCLKQHFRYPALRIEDPTAFGTWIEANPGMTYLIGNEPNQYDQDALDTWDYATMYHAYYELIKAHDPSAQVAVAGIYGNPAVSERTVERIIQWWEDVFFYYERDYGSIMPIDIWNFHVYVPPHIRDENWVMNSFVHPFTNWAKTVKDSAYEDCPIWLTEWAVAAWTSPLSMQWTIPYMQRMCLALEKSDVDRWFWFLGAWDSTGNFSEFCLIGPNGQPTEIGQVYSDLARNYPNTEATPIPDPTPLPAPDLFTDDFSNAKHPDWLEVAGEWVIDGTTYRCSKTGPWWGYISQLPYEYEDLTFEADVKINSAPDPNNWVGLSFRIPYLFHARGYLVYLRQNGNLGVYNYVVGEGSELENVVEDTSVFHRIRVECKGLWGTTRIYVDGEFILEWEDTRIRNPSGYVGLQAGKTDCSFDNVVVQKGISDASSIQAR